MKNDSYSKERGLFDSDFEERSLIGTININASESKVLEQRETTIGMSVCSCGRNDAFKIFFRCYNVVAKCTACDNEAVVYQG
jgi:hypothetical protein